MAASATPKKSTPRKKTSPSPLPAAASSISDFRKGSATSIITLPSGNCVETRRPGIHEFMSSGVIPDSLRPMVVAMVEQGQRKTPSQRKADEARLAKAMQDAIGDPRQLAEMMRAMKRVAALTWINPKLVFHEKEISLGHGPEWVVIPQEERDLETYLYTDEIDEEDITFTFNYVAGGTGDLERFRQDTGASVAALLRGEDVGVPAE
jgi:hypothetical protein